VFCQQDFQLNQKEGSPTNRNKWHLKNVLRLRVYLHGKSQKRRRKREAEEGTKKTISNAFFWFGGGGMKSTLTKTPIAQIKTKQQLLVQSPG